jgi:FkbM family methyltransferase
MQGPSGTSRTIKSRLQGALPVPVWNAAARLAERAADALAAGTTVVLRVFPTDARLQIRRHLQVAKPLDYAHSRILMRVSSRWERRLRLRSCAKEPETVAWLEQSLKQGDVLYDIGANVGAYSLVAARLPGNRNVSVYSFEPSAQTFDSLIENIALNGLADRVIALPIALTNQTGILQFAYSSTEAGAASHPGLMGAGARSQSVLGYRLDDCVTHLSIPRPTHMKIDVDGSELLVLQGAEDLLQTQQLRSILVETDQDGATGREVRMLLEKCGFELVNRVTRGGGVANYVYSRPQK